jgi:hypothetical protein
MLNVCCAECTKKGTAGSVSANVCLHAVQGELERTETRRHRGRFRVIIPALETEDNRYCGKV